MVLIKLNCTCDNQFQKNNVKKQENKKFVAFRRFLHLDLCSHESKTNHKQYGFKCLEENTKLVHFCRFPEEVSSISIRSKLFFQPAKNSSRIKRFQVFKTPDNKLNF